MADINPNGVTGLVKSRERKLPLDIGNNLIRAAADNKRELAMLYEVFKNNDPAKVVVTAGSNVNVMNEKGV